MQQQYPGLFLQIYETDSPQLPREQRQREEEGYLLKPAQVPANKDTVVPDYQSDS